MDNEEVIELSDDEIISEEAMCAEEMSTWDERLSSSAQARLGDLNNQLQFQEFVQGLLLKEQMSEEEREILMELNSVGEDYEEDEMATEIKFDPKTDLVPEVKVEPEVTYSLVRMLPNTEVDLHETTVKTEERKLSTNDFRTMIHNVNNILDVKELTSRTNKDAIEENEVIIPDMRESEGIFNFAKDKENDTKVSKVTTSKSFLAESTILRKLLTTQAHIVISPSSPCQELVIGGEPITSHLPERYCQFLRPRKVTNTNSKVDFERSASTSFSKPIKSSTNYNSLEDAPLTFLGSTVPPNHLRAGIHFALETQQIVTIDDEEDKTVEQQPRVTSGEDDVHILPSYNPKSYLKSSKSDSGQKGARKKLLKCNYCDKTYNSETSAKIHYKLVHSKIFECRRCNKKYLSQDSLSQHEKKHLPTTVQKPFKCPYSIGSTKGETTPKEKKLGIVQGKFKCLASFENKASLQDHLRKHHKFSQVFECGVCDKSFFSVELLNSHVLKMHVSVDVL